MTLLQEANSLMQNLSESDMRLVVGLLHIMNQRELGSGFIDQSSIDCPEQKNRMGIFKGKYVIPKDLNKHFDDDNEEIWSGFFEGGNL